MYFLALHVLNGGLTDLKASYCFLYDFFCIICTPHAFGLYSGGVSLQSANSKSAISDLFISMLHVHCAVQFRTEAGKGSAEHNRVQELVFFLLLI